MNSENFPVVNKKNIFYWVLYDFANSIVSINFFLYFAEWFIVEKNRSDFGYNMILALASLILLLVAPVLGSIADKRATEFSWLRIATFSSFLFYGLTGLSTIYFTEIPWLAGGFYVLALSSYLFSFGFYNALLQKIAPPEKRGFISGLGQAGNWLGNIFGLLISLPLLTIPPLLGNLSGRTQVFIPATLLFLLFTFPMMFLFQRKKEEITILPLTISKEYSDYWKNFRALLLLPFMSTFLLGYFFFNDALITLSNNYPVFLERVFGVSDQTKSFILIGILCTSVAGALVSGWVSDRIGHKKALFIILWGFGIIFPALALLTSLTTHICVVLLMGFFFGSVWTVTRAIMAELTPPDKLNFAFSFYTIFERFATFVGPISWGLIVYFVPGLVRYRIATFAMSLFVFLGMYISRKLPDLKQTKNE